MPTVFVYGAVMTHPHVLAHGEAAYVGDHAIRFVVAGLPFLEPAFAAIEPAPGERAWGVVADWPEARWARVVRRERPYVERPVIATTRSGVARSAVALFLVGRRLLVEGTPSARYASLLVRGAERFEFPEDTTTRYRRLMSDGPQLTLGIASWLGRRAIERA